MSRACPIPVSSVGDVSIAIAMYINNKNDKYLKLLTPSDKYNYCAAGNHGADVLIANTDMDVNWAPDRKLPLLFTAIHNNSVSLVKLILDKGVNLDGADRISSLCVASKYGRYEIMGILMDAYADTSADQMATLLHVACSNGHEKTVLMLLGRGADIHAKDCFGRTAIHLGCIGKYTKLVEKLCELGADINAIDNFGYSPLAYAT